MTYFKAVSQDLTERTSQNLKIVGMRIERFNVIRCTFGTLE
jgi:hypothetical protein